VFMTVRRERDDHDRLAKRRIQRHERRRKAIEAEQAAAIAGDDTPAIGACRIGKSMPNRSIRG